MSNKLKTCFLIPMLLTILSFMWSCGSGSSIEAPVTSVSFSDGSSVSIVPAGNGKYVLQGNNLNGVGGIDVDADYDSSAMASPTVTQGDFFSGALFAFNATTPGVIRIAAVSTTPYSGSGPIATFSFATDSGLLPSLSLKSVEMIDTDGKKVQQL